MLYERWRQISSERRQQLALRDVASGRNWTFGELWEAGESRPVSPAAVAFPEGGSPDFIPDLLAAWREKKMACPLEPGQARPQFPSPPEGCIHLKCTSATSGTPRLVAFTGAQLAADAANIVATMGLRPEWPNIGVISLAHSYGFSNLVLPLLLHGIPLILLPAPLPELLRRAAAAEAAVTLAAVPAMWRAWAESRAIPKNARLAISAAAPLPLALEKSVFESDGIKIHNFYGASECGGIAYDASATPREDAACAGSPMSNASLTLDAEGCLLVRSQAVGETYWPTASSALRGGIFQTSDLAELRRGQVFLRGRLDDQMNIAGRKLSPEIVERALMADSRVRDCLVLGAPDARQTRSEMVVAIVVGDVSETELQRLLLKSLPAWQIPRQWHFVDSLSANARGKLLRKEWRSRLALG